MVSLTVGLGMQYMSPAPPSKSKKEGKGNGDKGKGGKEETKERETGKEVVTQKEVGCSANDQLSCEASLQVVRIMPVMTSGQKERSAAMNALMTCSGTSS